MTPQPPAYMLVQGVEIPEWLRLRTARTPGVMTCELG